MAVNLNVEILFYAQRTLMQDGMFLDSGIKFKCKTLCKYKYKWKTIITHHLHQRNIWNSVNLLI